MISVMVVEDDPMVMDITCKYVEHVEGFSVRARASDGAAAMRLLENIKIDLMVLDIYMPVMNGVELLKRVRGKQIAVDALFLTADSNISMIGDALKLGAVDYLIKPFSYERFKAALEHYRERSRLFRGSGRTTQEQIDTLIMGNTPYVAGIQKGLHPKTLGRIREYISGCGGDAITQEEISGMLGLSKVTVRRYMEYLVSTDEVCLHIEYGSVGRPAYTYKKLT